LPGLRGSAAIAARISESQHGAGKIDAQMCRPGRPGRLSRRLSDYLDVETGPPVQQKFILYYQAWVQAVIDNGFTPGVYCSHHLASQFIGADNRAAVWVFQLAQMGGNFTPPLPRPDPSHSSFAGAKVLQYAQNATLNLNGTIVKPVDLNTALVADPSSLSAANGDPTTDA
jgi:hypothetical protein